MGRNLRFNKNGRFKILQLTDLHWESAYDELDDVDKKTEKIINSVMDLEKPDFVVVTGDMISGSVTEAPIVLKRSLECINKFHVPFASVFGNHDVENVVSKDLLIKAQMELSNCLTKVGPALSTGRGNFLLDIQSTGGRDIAWRLYMIDSGCQPFRNDLGEYDWIQRDQIQWYVEESLAAKNKYGKTLPALAFFHIPLPEFNDVWDYEICYGMKNEEVCCPDLNSGLFSAMVEMGDVKGVFVGHDHYNYYYGSLHGITLGYGWSSGARTHKTSPWFIHGARVIELKEGEKEITTWIRLWDGTKIVNPEGHKPEGRYSHIESNGAENIF